MTSNAIEYSTASPEALASHQIEWVYRNATKSRVAAACRLLLGHGGGEGWPVDHPDAIPAYQAARQLCAEAWNEGRALARRRLRVNVSLLDSRPSPRILTSAEERATAMDWGVIVTVRDWTKSDDSAVVMEGDGSVSLYQPRREREPELWSPCRHCSDCERDELSWVHGGLRRIIAWLQQLSPTGIEVARQLVATISGEDMRFKEARPALLDVDPGGIIPGDIVEHRNSHRVGVAEPRSRVCWDCTVEHPIRVFGGEPVQWNSACIRFLRWEDPYRRYLELRWRAENDGVVVSTQDWARLAIELAGVGMPDEASATGRKITLVNPGDARAIKQARSHWWKAAEDCSRRTAGTSASSSSES